MVLLGVFLLLCLYTLVIDWAYLVPRFRIAWRFELIIIVSAAALVAFLFWTNPEFYGPRGGRKIDLILIVWILREVIHSRVRSYDHARQMTAFVRRVAVSGAREA